MAIGAGFSRTATDGLVFGYDTADGINSFKGQPTINRFALPGTAGPGPGSNNNVGFEVNGTGTFVRLGWGQTIGGYTIRQEDVVYSYVLGSNGCHYHGNDVSIPGGTYATFTMDYYVTPDATGFPENSTLLVFENALGGSTGVNSEVGVWRTVTFTSGPTGGSGTLRMLIYPGGCGPRMASSGTLYMKNPRVEYRSYGTPFVNGTRSSTQSLLNMKGTQPIVNVSDVSFNSSGQMLFDGTSDFLDLTQDVLISDTNQGWTAEYVFKTNSAETLQHFNSAEADDFNANWLALYNSNLAVWNVDPGYWKYGDTVFSSNRYYHVAFVCDPGGTNYRFYVNGIREGGDHVGNSWGASYSRFVSRYIGRYEYSGVYERYFGGEIPVAKMYNRALTDTELASNYFHYATRYNMTEYRYSEGGDASKFLGNWNNSTTYTMADFGGLGNVTAHGWSNGPATYTLTLQNIPSHTQVRYKVFWHLVDSLDTETNRLLIGNGSSEGEILTFTKQYNLVPNVSYIASETFAPWSGPKTYSYRPWANGYYNQDGYLLIDSGWKSHTTSTFTAKHIMGADQAQADEAMYLSHVEVLFRY
jgi:hypothetical protein